MFIIQTLINQHNTLDNIHSDHTAIRKVHDTIVNKLPQEGSGTSFKLSQHR